MFKGEHNEKQPQESWIRGEVIDHQGRRAWTNPIWL